MKLHTLLITGGHPTPALAVIDEIREHHPHLQVLFVGRRYMNVREKADSLEYQEVSARNVRFIHTAAKRGSRGMVELPYHTLECISLLKKEKPDVILSFGGYISVPVCVAAYLLRIPFFLHEQTIRPGTANIRLARLATKVMVSFRQTAHYFEKDKVIVTGNPLRKNIVQNISSAKFSHLAPPIILVQGGNLGSHSINTHIFELLPQLVTKYSVIHQVGNVKEFGDWERAQTKGAESILLAFLRL
jgi:UDP-N-acetylglucosamine--N-acetylmuramyl-(pentapeptide) pyrophosphoryl-undecaprenol N-acetylglucosamine transferase